MAPEAGTRVMRRLAAKPMAAMASVTTPMRQGVRLPDGEEHAAAGDAEHDRHEGAHFEQRVAAREIAVGEHLGHDAVFGGAEDGGVQAHQEDDEQHAFGPAGDQRRSPKSMMAISKSLTPISTRRLLTRSARWPEYPLKSSEGSVKTAGTSGTYARIGVAARGGRRWFDTRCR